MKTKFPQTNFENKLIIQQSSVQHLVKQDWFIYIQDSKRLVKPFYSNILMHVLSVLFVGPKPRFPHVMHKLKEITMLMLALACMWVSLLGSHEIWRMSQ